MDVDDTSFNAEIKMMQEVETVRSVPAVDFQRFENVDYGESVIADDLTYIMQSTFIQPVEVENSVLSDQDTSEDSESDSNESDEDVRITLVKDKNTVSHQEETIHISSEDDESHPPAKTSNKIKEKISGNLVNNNDTTEDCAIIEKIECDESVVHKLLQELVNKTMKVLGKECSGEKGLDYSSDDSQSSENEAGHSSLLSIIKGENQVINIIPRVPDEVLPEELVVDVEEIVLTPKDHLNQIGVISGVVEKMVVVKSNINAPALDGESAFFFENKTYIGKVFDTFGPVKVPFYTVHLSKKVDVSKLSVGTKVYYVPFNQEITKYVFIEQLKKIKGSDASWRNDWEPPVGCLDYSDDEEEQHIKRQHKVKSKVETSNSNISGCQTKKAPQKNRVNKFNHSDSSNQNVKGIAWKPGQMIPNLHLGVSISDPSRNNQILNQPQPRFNKASLQDSNSTTVNQNIKIHAPPVLPILPPQIPIFPPRIPILQPPMRQQIKNFTRFSAPPLLNDFPPRRPHNFDMNQNMQLNNGIFPASFPPQLPPPFGALQNQQVLMPPQNHLIIRPQFPVSAAPLHAPPGRFNVLDNKPPCDVLPNNTRFTHRILDNSVAVAHPPSTTLHPFGHCPPHQNFQSSGNVLPGNSIPNKPQKPDMSHFSLNSTQDTGYSRKKPEGIVKLNGFTFKL